MKKKIDYKDKIRQLLIDLYEVEVIIINNTLGANILRLKGYLNENAGLLEVINTKYHSDYEEKITFKFSHINKIEFELNEINIYIDASGNLDDMLSIEEDRDDEMDDLL